MDVVVRFLEVPGKFYIAHAASYQAAFKPGFDTRQDAITFALANGGNVLHHAYDALQVLDNHEHLS